MIEIYRKPIKLPHDDLSPADISEWVNIFHRAGHDWLQSHMLYAKFKASNPLLCACVQALLEHILQNCTNQETKRHTTGPVKPLKKPSSTILYRNSNLPKRQSRRDTDGKCIQEEVYPGVVTIREQFRREKKI